MRFSNRHGNVFLVEGDEEEVASLFARYSRSPLGLREQYAAMAHEAGAEPPSFADCDDTIAARLADEMKRRAARLHEKYVVGYGHGSVAEHAVVHLGVERCSIVAAKAIEERRLGLAYTEKSTRYVKFDEGSMLLDGAVPEAASAEYAESCRRLMRSYLRLAASVESRLASDFPGVPDGARRAKALDLLRGLLPASTLTNVGVTGNARAVAHAVRVMRGSPLPEVRSVADAIHRESSVSVPTLLRRSERDGHTAEAAARVFEAVSRLSLDGLSSVASAAFLRSISGSRSEAGVQAGLVPQHSVRLLRAIGLSHCDVASNIIAWTSGRLPPELADGPAPFSHADSAKIIDAYLGGRPERGRVGRALEGSSTSWEITCDYGAWRDLQRHRVVSATTPRLDATLGFWRSPSLEHFGVAAEFDDEVDRAGRLARSIAQDDPDAAQYATPMAYRVRYRLDLNLRELFHLVELRSARGGHESYRWIAQQMGTVVCNLCPWLSGHLRVDREHYDFARQG